MNELEKQFIEYYKDKRLITKELEGQLHDLAEIAGEHCVDTLGDMIKSIEETEKENAKLKAKLDNVKYLNRLEVEKIIKPNKWIFENTKRDIEQAATEEFKKEIQKHTDSEWKKLITTICNLAIKPIDKDSNIPKGAKITSAKLYYEDGTFKELSISGLNKILPQ